MRKNIDPKLFESGDFFLFGAHADMTLIDERVRARSRAFIFPDIWHSRIPNLRAKHLGNRILHDSPHVGREPFATAAWPFYEQFVELPVVEEHFRKFDFPVSRTGRRERIGGRPFPVVEFTDEVDSVRMRRPFTKYPTAVISPVQSIIEVIVKALRQRPVDRKLVTGIHYPFMSGFYRLFKWLQIRIHFVYLLHNSQILSIPSALSLTDLRYVLHDDISSFARFTYLSISSILVAGSSTSAAIFSNSATAFP